MSADSFHHQVELSMKQCGKIYDFADYEQCVKNSSSGKVDVKSIRVSEFRDWPDVSSSYMISRMTPRPYPADIVWLRAERGKHRRPLAIWRLIDFSLRWAGLLPA